MTAYEQLLERALSCIRKDIESRFELAGIFRELVVLCGDLDKVAKDLHWNPGDIQRYLNVIELFGDRRLPDADGRPASWRVYASLASDYSNDVAMQEIAFSRGRPGFDDERARRAAETRARRVWSPRNDGVTRAVKDSIAVPAAAESARKAWSQLAGVASAGYADADALASLRSNYLELTKQMLRLGLVESAQRLSS